MKRGFSEVPCTACCYQAKHAATNARLTLCIRSPEGQGCSWLSHGSVLLQRCLLPLGMFPLPAWSQHGDNAVLSPCKHTSHRAAPVLPSTAFCFWVTGMQAVGRIHSSPPLSRNQTASKQFGSHCYAAQPSQWRFSRKQSSKEHFGAAEAGIPNGICGHRALDSH